MASTAPQLTIPSGNQALPVATEALTPEALADLRSRLGLAPAPPAAPPAPPEAPPAPAPVAQPAQPPPQAPVAAPVATLGEPTPFSGPPNPGALPFVEFPAGLIDSMNESPPEEDAIFNQYADQLVYGKGSPYAQLEKTENTVQDMKTKGMQDIARAEEDVLLAKQGGSLIAYKTKAAVLNSLRERQSKMDSGELPDRVAINRQRMREQSKKVRQTADDATRAVGMGVRQKGLLEDYSPGNKLLGIIGIALSGIGAGMAGRSSNVMSMLQNRVKADLEAQKEAIRGKERLADKAMNLYDRFERDLGSAEAAEKAFVATTWEQVGKVLDIAKDATNSKIRGAEIGVLREQTQHEAAQGWGEVAIDQEKRLASVSAKEQEIDYARKDKFTERRVSGTVLVPGELPSVNESKDMGDAMVAARKISFAYKELENILNTYDPQDLLNPTKPAAKRLVALNSYILPQKNQLDKMGVPSGSELRLSMESMGNPKDLLSRLQNTTTAKLVQMANQDLIRGLKYSAGDKFIIKPDVLKELYGMADDAGTR